MTLTQHKEILSLDTISSLLFPVILGLSWLQAHNPQIDWATGKINFPSTYSQQHCLPEPSNTPATLLCIDSENETRQAMPKPYHDYIDVFSKRGSDVLPPHQPYDCPIELLPGAEIPFGKIFPLLEREQKALKDYVQENLKKRLHPAFYFSSRGRNIFCRKKGSLAAALCGLLTDQ